MPFYNDERLRRIRVGIDSYTNNELALDVIGNTNIFADGGLGINTTNSEGYGLYVDGDGYFTGVVTARTFYAGPTEITGGAFADDLTVTTLKVNGISTLGALVGAGETSTFIKRGANIEEDLFVGGDANISGILTVFRLEATELQTPEILFTLNDLSVSGFVTYTGTDDNILGDVNTGILQIDGGAGLEKNVSIGASLWVGGNIGVGSTQPTARLDVVGLTELDELNVSGLSTFASDVDINASVDISGDLVVQDDLNVAGLSTFTSDLDVNASVDISSNLTVDGLSDLDELNVAGLSTFASDLDVNASVDISTNLTVDGLSDLDELNVSGVSTFTDITDNTLGNVDTGALQIDGGLGVAKNVSIGGSLYVQGQSEFIGVVTFRGGTINIGDQDTDDINVGGEFVSNLVPNDDDSYDLGSPTKEWRNLYVDGLAEIDDLNVAGLSTFASDVDVNASVDISSNLTVDGLSDLDELNVAGLSTFASNVDVNASVDISTNLTVDGLSDLDELNVAGLSTFASDVDVNASVDISSNLTVDGLSDLDELNVAGIATFTSDLDVNASVDISTNLTVDGLSDLDELNVVGVSTFASDVDVNASVDISSNLTVDGLSDLDELNVAGLSTFASNVDVNASVDISTNLTVDGLSDLDELNVAGLSTFAADLDVNASVDISSNLTVDGLSDLDELNVAGLSTFASDVDVNASIDVSNNLTVDGLSDLDELNVAGLSTFTSDLDVNASVDISSNLNVTGLSTFASDLDVNASVDISSNLNVTGLSTFASDVDVNASVDISNDLNVTGLSTFASDVDVNASVDISNDLNVTGLSTFASNVDVNASVDISSNLTVDGLSDLDELNVAGIATFASDLDVNASVDISSNLTVDGLSDLDELNVAGLSTFASDIDVNASVDISSNLTVDGLSDLDELNVAGIATFASDVDVNASVDISQTLNVTGIATFGNNVEITGDLTVNGTQTILNTQILEVEDINIGIASADPKLSDAALDGAGLTIHGAAGDKTLTWSNADSRMEFNTDLYSSNFESTNITANGNLVVDGLSDLDELNVAGIATFNSNVGIKTTTPSAELDVVGDARITGILTVGSASVVIDGDNNSITVGTGASIYTPSNNELTFGTNNQERVRIDSNGNVGINEVAPTSTLYVTGTTNISGVATFQDTVNIGTGGTTAFFDVSSGRVGINTITPTATFDVNGDTNIAGTVGIGTTNSEQISLYVDGDGYFTGVVTATTFFAGPTEITGGAFADDLVVTTLKVNGISTLGGNSIGAGETSVFIKQNANVEADLYVGDDLYVSGVSTFVGVGTFGDDLYVAGSLNVVGVTTFSNNLIVDSNLGVGTDNPTSGFADPSNTSIINTGIVTANQIYGSFYGDGSNLQNISADGQGADGAVQYNNGGLLAGASDFFYDDVNLRIGIGSTVPTVKLDVDGDANITGIVTAQEFVGIGSQLTNITFRQLSDVDGSNLVAGSGISSTPDYLVIYDPLLDAFRFVDPKSYFGINNDFDPDPAIVDYGSY